MGGRMLRPEARPLELDKLTKQQLEAVSFVVGHLEGARDQLINADDEDDKEPPELDPRRSSRILFMTGEFGTGKSTIYTSLRSGMEAEKSGPESTGRQGEDKQEGDLRRRISDLGKNVIWLAPLDLEPLAESTNFLAAVLVRIEAALTTSSNASGGKSRIPSLLDPDRDSQDGLMTLQRLQSDIVLAWDGNIKSRAGQVEPDTHASEVIRAEKARLSLNKRFQKVLSKLSRVNTVSHDKRKLFVLVVDDLYLNPSVSIELLRLLRLISSPQLFVLLLGDYDTAEFLFYQQTLGEYVRLAGEAVYQRDAKLQDRMNARAWALATGSLRKLVPPGHRHELSPLNTSDALEFIPLRDASKKLKNDCPKLKDLLAKVPILKGGQPASLADILMTSWAWRKDKDEEKMDAGLRKDRLLGAPYTGTRLLEMPPRHATDLWMKLHDANSTDDESGKVDEDRAIEVATDELYASLDEQTRLSDDTRTGLQEAIQPGKLLLDYALDTSRLRIRIDERRKEFSCSVEDVRGADLKTSKIKIFRRVAWDLELLEGKKFRTVEFIPRPLGWLVVLHDVLALCRVQNLVDGPLTRYEPVEGEDLQVVSWKQMHPGVCDPRETWMRVDWKRNQRDGWVDCHSPAWKTFWEFDTLCAAWNDLTREVESKSAHWASYVFRWIEAISEILAKAKKPQLTRIEDPSNPPKEDAWDALAGRVAKLADDDVKRKDPIAADWLIHLGYLVAARAGIPELGAICLERQESLKAFWLNTVAKEVQQYCRSGEGPLQKNRMLADQIPAEWPDSAQQKHLPEKRTGAARPKAKRRLPQT
jgi:hypothetical protein